MNETLKTIYNRRAVRKYYDKPVTKVEIEQILNAGRMAPSALNKQPWKFYIITDKQMMKMFSKEIITAAAKKMGEEVIKKIAMDFHFQTQENGHEADPVFHNAPVAIFITAPKDNEWAPLDIGMCSQNIMLAAKSLGLDSCPVGFGAFVEQTPDFLLMRIPDSERVLICIVIGYGAENPPVHERVSNNEMYINAKVKTSL